MTTEMNSGKDCAHAWEIMPWVLQATAPHEQGEWLMHHLAQCESCSAEFAQQSRLRSALSLASDVPVDADTGLKRLMERLDTPEPKALPAGAWPRNRLAGALAVAVLVEAIGIGVLGARLWSDQAAQYGTLSQPALYEPAGAIRVVPATSMALSEWNRLLHDLDLRVVDGPNAVGAYTVVPEGSPARSAQLIPELRASHGIRLAEPIDDRP